MLTCYLIISSPFSVNVTHLHLTGEREDRVGRGGEQQEPSHQEAGGPGQRTLRLPGIARGPEQEALHPCPVYQA
jgi:hypothetical protein